MNIAACDGLPTGVVSCEEDSIVKCKFINIDLFSNYRFLYSYVYVVNNNIKEYIAIGRIVYIDTDKGEAYIDDSTNIDESDYTYNNTYRFSVYKTIDPDETKFTEDCTIELGCSINGYDGEIGVDTGGKFYQWSVDKDGAGNEVWQSLYKCVSYAREIKRHIIGIDRACVLNVAFNDPKWGWIGSLEANTAVNVINYHTNLRGGPGDDTYDKYLGVDSFRCQLGKARTSIPLITMRRCSKKTDGGQVLYKQIWEAIVWSYVIEYVDFDVKKTYNYELTVEGYHQGGLGNGVIGGNDLIKYNYFEKLVPHDYTLEFGNNTIIKRRHAKQFDVSVVAKHYWNKYDYSNVVATKSSNNKILTITSTKVLTTDYNIFAYGNTVGGTTKYKITGLTDDQTVVFKREQGNLTITADGTYDVNWGTSNVLRKIYFGKLQTTCNIVIEILSAPAYTLIQNQIDWNIPHWRGFNVFWYGDIFIVVDNTISKYDTSKQKRIWYYTDDVSKFSDDTTNKEHQIEGLGNETDNWLQEIRLNNNGDIVPIKIVSNNLYKNSYSKNNVEKYPKILSVGSDASEASENHRCGLFYLNASYDISGSSTNGGFVKVTILDT